MVLKKETDVAVQIMTAVLELCGTMLTSTTYGHAVKLGTTSIQLLGQKCASAPASAS